MLIPLSSLEQNPSSNYSRRRSNNIISRLTKIIIIHKKRAALFTIGVLGIIHYFYFTPYDNQHNKKELFNDKFAAHTKESDASSSSSYLYPPQEAYPVIDYNPNNNDDFQTLNTPTVIEFYDPKCGACQSFKYNYIEIAKKIKEERPNVQFFGVSCELYKSTCDDFDVKRFPKILVFPERNDDAGGGRITKDDGIEVPKGTGTIYFVSARIMKALRTKEEIEMNRVDPAKFVDGT